MQIGAVAVLILLCAGNAFLFLAIVEFHNPRPSCLLVPIP